MSLSLVWYQEILIDFSIDIIKAFSNIIKCITKHAVAVNFDNDDYLGTLYNIEDGKTLKCCKIK